MKKTLSTTILIFMIITYAWGAVQIRSLIGPTSTRNANVTITAAGTGVRNCLSQLDVQAKDTLATLDVLDGGTTIYSLDLSSNTSVVRDWDFDANAACGTANTQMEIKVSTTAGGTWIINHRGFTY